jgi:hypothetical protein
MMFFIQEANCLFQYVADQIVYDLYVTVVVSKIIKHSQKTSIRFDSVSFTKQIRIELFRIQPNSVITNFMGPGQCVRYNRGSLYPGNGKVTFYTA